MTIETATLRAVSVYSSGFNSKDINIYFSLQFCCYLLIIRSIWYYHNSLVEAIKVMVCSSHWHEAESHKSGEKKIDWDSTIRQYWSFSHYSRSSKSNPGSLYFKPSSSFILHTSTPQENFFSSVKLKSCLPLQMQEDVWLVMSKYY